MTDMDAATNAIALEILELGLSLPPLPAAGTQLLAFAQKPIDEIDVSQFTKLVESDPALCVKVLQLANSSYFGAIKKIISLHQAIMHIGLEETLNAAYLFFCQNTLPQLPAMEGFSGQEYWAHSWACAVANRMLGHPDYMVKTLPGELYVAGLLHGIGKLIIALYSPQDFMQCLRISKEFSKPLSEVEKKIFGTTDALIAYRIMKSWQLPNNICAAVKYYQSPETAEEEFQEIAALTQFSYFISNTSGIGSSGDEFCCDLSETWISRNTFSPLADPSVQRKLVQDILATLQAKALNVTGMEAKEVKPPRKAPSAEEAPRRNEKQGGLWSRIKSIFGG